MDIQNLYSLFQSSNGVSIDSRSIEKDEIFFSIKGENFDGNRFALDAIDKGAKFSIVDDPISDFEIFVVKSQIFCLLE